VEKSIWAEHWNNSFWAHRAADTRRMIGTESDELSSYQSGRSGEGGEGESGGGGGGAPPPLLRCSAACPVSAAAAAADGWELGRVVGWVFISPAPDSSMRFMLLFILAPADVRIHHSFLC
jgi:hypothetical protein